MPTTTNYKRGAVVLLPFPFSDQSTAKVRPAVVVHGPYPSDDVLVVAVTSIRGTLRPGECALRHWREAGLIHPSFLKRAVTTVAAHFVRRSLGTLHAEDVAQLNNALRLWFGM